MFFHALSEVFTVIRKNPGAAISEVINVLFRFSLATLLLGVFLIPSASFGAAIEFTDAPVTHDSQLSLGFVFTTTEAVSVTALGYYDENKDGFLTDHEVGIFDTSGSLLVSSVLNMGTDSSLDGHYRYTAISPISLAGNSSYIIAATTAGLLDGIAYGRKDETLTGFVVDPRISVASDAARFLYQSDNVLRVPDQMFGYTIYGGPNFVLAPAEASSVPEPASFAFVLGGVAGLVFVSRRKRPTVRE
jgi:hypothetical protein